MNRAIRIIIPILLAVAIIVCLGWYLFVYDRDFTRDMLLHSARYFESQGRHNTASFVYDLAYRQAGDNDAVAIELAEQHKIAGNYTKAEYVLNQAIAEGASEELYIALCKTYVEQDKLLDAIKLLDTICREDSPVPSAIKEALIEKRPTVPISVPSPGFYNQYISVTLESETGTLYANPTGEYPSIHKDAYVEPITLAAGENRIYAVAISDNGLVSPLAILGYTVGGVIENISFSDPAIDAEVRSVLNIAEDKSVLSSDLWEIKEFNVPAEAKDYSDLKHMQNLEKLTIASGASGQLNNISSMTQLSVLEITNTAVSADELEIIGSLSKLQRLTLSSCGLSTTTGLARLGNLIYLDLSKNTIRNIDALASMKSLSEVNLQHNALTDLTALSGCSSLSSLDVSHNSLATISPISGLSGLKKLNASNNRISQLGNMAQLTALNELSLAYNQLTDVISITECTSVAVLDISNNVIGNISPLEALSTLTHLNFSYNQVVELPQWNKECALIEINGSHNQLSSLTPLSGLKNLNSVYMDYNTEIDSILDLADCHVLILVSVYGTKVTEVKTLTDQSIIVHYNPTQG